MTYKIGENERMMMLVLLASRDEPSPNKTNEQISHTKNCASFGVPMPSFNGLLSALTIARTPFSSNIWTWKDLIASGKTPISSDEKHGEMTHRALNERRILIKQFFPQIW